MTTCGLLLLSLGGMTAIVVLVEETSKRSLPSYHEQLEYRSDQDTMINVVRSVADILYISS